MSTLAPIYIPINGVDGFSKEFSKMQKSLKKTAARFKKTGQTLTMGLTLPLVGLGIAAGKSSLSMNAAMANVATLIPENTARVVALKKSIQDISPAVGKTGTDLSAGMYQMISAIGDTSESMSKLKLSARAAQAGIASTEESVNLLTTVTKGYGDTSLMAMKNTADFAFQTVKLGKTTFPELASSMGKATAMAQPLKISQRELFANYATLTGVTGNTAEVSTQLTAIMSAMLKPTTELSKTVNSMGYASASAMVKQHGLNKSLHMLNKAVGNNADYMAQLLGRKEALTAALALTGTQSDVFTEKMKKMGASSGALTSAFDAQTKGINKNGFQMKQSLMSLTVAGQRMGDVIVPALAAIVVPVANLVTRFAKLPTPVLKTIAVFAGLLILVGPLIVGIGMLITAFTVITGAMAVAGGAMALLFSPVVLVVGGIALLILTVGLLWNKLDLLKAVVGGGLVLAFRFLSPILKTVVTTAKLLFGIFGKLFVIFSPIVSLIAMIGGALMSLPLALVIKSFQGWLMILNPILKAVDWLLNKLVLLSEKLGGFLNIWKKTGDETKKGLGAIPINETQGAGTGLGDLGLPPQGGFNNLDLSGLGGLGKKEEALITIDFLNVQSGVKITKEKGNVIMKSNTGSIMDGGF